MAINLMTISKAAEEYGIVRRTLAERVQGGHIPSYKGKGRIYVLAKDVEEYKEKAAQSRRGPHFMYVSEGHSEGKSDYAMSKELGLSRERIRQIRSKLGLPRNPRSPTLPKAFAPAQRKTLLDMYIRRTGE
jgi:hypothetical protein